MSRDLLTKIGGAYLTDIIRIPPPPWLFAELVRDEAVGALLSPPHSYKSVLMLDMALCMDFNLKLFGRYPPIRGDHVPFIWSVDGPDWDMGRIATKLMIGHGLSPEQRAMASIAGRWTRGLRVTDPRVWNPNKPRESWLWEWQQEHGLTHLFIDTKLAATMVSENDALQSEMITEHFKSARDILGIGVTYTHHTAKPNENSPRSGIYAGRGSSADPGAVDWQIVLNSAPRPGGGSRVTFDWAKSRGDFPPNLNYIDVIPVPTEERDPGGGPLVGLRLAATQADRDDALMALLRERPRPRAELCQAFPGDMSEEQKAKAVDNWLQAKRKIGAVESDGKGTWKITAG